jgi:hypothetical protein
MTLKIIYISFLIFFLVSIYFSYRLAGKQLINAYSFFSIEIFAKVSLSSVLVFMVSGEVKYYLDVINVLLVSFVYLASIFFGFLMLGSANKFLKCVGFVFWKTKNINYFNGSLPLYSFLFFIFAVLLFSIMMVKGGGGMLWVTDSRFAYQHFRGGVGFFYTFSKFFVYVSFVLLLFSFKKYKNIKIILFTLMFVVFLYFFGSKRGMLTLVLISVVYYSYYVNRISLLKMSVFFLFLFVLFLFSQVMYSNYGLLESLFYFTYFDNLVLFFNQYNDFQYMHGKAALSQLWSLVPRSFYPEKPYFFGSAYLTEFLYPGMADKGHFLGALPWVIYYLDFGVYGVFLAGLVTGIFLRFLQVLLLIEKNIFTFIIFINFSISNILGHVPFFVLFLFLFIMLFFLRIRLKIPLKRYVDASRDIGVRN